MSGSVPHPVGLGAVTLAGVGRLREKNGLRLRGVWATGVCIVACLLPAAAAPVALATEPAPTLAGLSPSRRVAQGPVSRFMLPDGRPLPFANVEELREFLRTAPIIEREDIPTGSTNPERLTLERDGVRLRAIFRDVDVERERYRLRDGTFYMNFRDNALFEVAAYELARLLGIDNLPPAVGRVIDSQRGSVQLWIEGEVMTETDRIERRLVSPSALRWRNQMQVLRNFDYLIGNHDRNTGNLLIDGSWNIWLVDHTRTFQLAREDVEPDRVQVCPIGLFDRMRALTDEEVRPLLDDYLRPAEIDGIFRRRDNLVAHIERLIQERGRGAVLIESGDRDL